MSSKTQKVRKSNATKVSWTKVRVLEGDDEEFGNWDYGNKLEVD